MPLNIINIACLITNNFNVHSLMTNIYVIGLIKMSKDIVTFTDLVNDQLVPPPPIM